MSNASGKHNNPESVTANNIAKNIRSKNWQNYKEKMTHQQSKRDILTALINRSIRSKYSTDTENMNNRTNSRYYMNAVSPNFTIKKHIFFSKHKKHRNQSHAKPQRRFNIFQIIIKTIKITHHIFRS